MNLMEILNRIHDALMRAVWRDTWEPVLRDPAVLAAECGLDASDLDQWTIACRFWKNLVTDFNERMMQS